MNFFLNVSPENYNDNILELLGPFQTFSFGTQILLLGIAAVFAVLGIIFALLTIFKKVFSNVSTDNKEHTVKEEPVYTEVSAPNEQEIVAVIAAAIAMAESETDNVKFRVVSFRRK